MGLVEGRRLAEEHQALEAMCDAVGICVAKADWRECDMIWGRFCATVEDHFRFEERELWLEFGASEPDLEPQLNVLAAERSDIRAALERIGIEIELKYIDRAGIERLLAQLREHVRNERDLFYAWSSARPG